MYGSPRRLVYLQLPVFRPTTGTDPDSDPRQRRERKKERGQESGIVEGKTRDSPGKTPSLPKIISTSQYLS